MDSRRAARCSSRRLFGSSPSPRLPRSRPSSPASPNGVRRRRAWRAPSVRSTRTTSTRSLRCSRARIRPPLHSPTSRSGRSSPSRGRGCRWGRWTARSSSSSAAGPSPSGPRSAISSAPRCCSGSAAAASTSRRSPTRSRSSPWRSSSATAPPSRARILEWRSRCYQRARDWEAARADVERALELAESIGDEDTIAYGYFQASLIAEREGQWLLARFYAEEARDRYDRLGDRLNLHKLLNNLGGINFLLGETTQAVACLKEAFRLALELENDVGAGYAMSSLAQVQLRTGEPAQAEQHAKRALELLAGRVDHLDETGNAQLVLGRALLGQNRHDEAEQVFHAAHGSFERLGSVSHRAAAGAARDS